MKENKSILIISFALLVTLFVLPHIQSITGFMQERPLHGYTKNHAAPELSVSSWFNRSYQDTMEIYLKDSVALKPTFVRIRNEVDYLLFGKLYAKDVRIEKEGHFFRYTKYFVSGGNYPGDRKIEQDVIRLKKVQELLSRKGKKLVFVIAPDKLWFDQEFLLDKNTLNEKSTRFYRIYLKYLKEYKCDYIDLNAEFIRRKKMEKGLLFSKGGYHWTEYGAFVGMDSIANYLKNRMGVNIPDVEKTNFLIDNKPGFGDLDMLHACNLQFMPGLNETYTHPAIKVDEGKKVTTALICGDSFCHAICWTKFFWAYFKKESTFWYYNREIYNIDNQLLGNANEKIADNFIEKSDIYIVLFSAGNLEKYEYGFLNHFVK